MASATPAEMRETIKEQQEELERISNAPRLVATVLRTNSDYILLAVGGALTAVALYPGATLMPGTVVLVGAESGQILQVIGVPLGLGLTFTVTAVDVPPGSITIEKHGAQAVISPGVQTNIAIGDRVITDLSGLVVTDHIPMTTKASAPDKPVTWSDIGGQEEAKHALRETIELPLLHADIYAAYNKAAVKGVLLSGPPGCGKTMLGKALATSLEGGFIYVKGPELLNAYVGQSESNVRELFTQARGFKNETGRPAVIFIDEADALLGVRGARGAFMEKTIVPMFLAEMDGLEDSAAVMVLATNRPDQLDPAITREGRIDRKIHVSRPDEATALVIFTNYLSKSKVAGDVVELAKTANELLFNDGMAIFRVKTANSNTVFRLKNLVSGALIANIVEQASSIAVHRDIANGTAATGITSTDLYDAVMRVYKQNESVHHDEALRDFVQGKEITGVEKVHA